MNTAPADTARAMHAAYFGKETNMSADSKASKDQIQHNRNEAYQGGWDDGYAEGFAKGRTDLCITEAECQRRIDAAVLAEIANASVMFEQTVADLVKALKSADTYIDKGHYEMARNITRNAIRARGLK